MAEDGELADKDTYEKALHLLEDEEWEAAEAALKDAMGRKVAIGGKVIFMLPLYISLVMIHTKETGGHENDFTAPCYC